MAIINRSGELPTIDGAFSDWGEQHVVASDSEGDANGSFDITKVAATTSGSELYLHFDIGREINLSKGARCDGTLRLVVELPGSWQLTIDFRKRVATLNTVHEVSWAELGFVCLPTYASDHYELRLNLERFGVQRGDTVRLNFAGSDSLDEAAPIALQKKQERSTGATFARANAGDIRIASLNTLHQGMSDADRSGSSERPLAAAQADIYCFQEESEEKKFRKTVPRILPTGESPRIESHWSGGCGIATSLPLEPIPMGLDRGTAASLRLPNSKHLIVVSVHFKCCGYAGSREDRTRVRQARQLVPIDGCAANGPLLQAEYSLAPGFRWAPLVH